MVRIIDYGLGNLASVKNMVHKVGGKAEITSDLEAIRSAEKLILPGVGAFRKGMENLNEKGIPAAIKEATSNGASILGICLGAQLLTDHSEEGDAEGLGLIPAKTIRFQPEDPTLKVPHMGWNEIKVAQDHPIFSNTRDQQRFYFVHSYYMQCEEEGNVLCTAEYGQRFHAGIIKDKIIGLQFHPEKSHVFGMQVMKNFVELC